MISSKSATNCGSRFTWRPGRQEFSSKAELGKTGEGIGDALGKVGEELKLGYQRIRNAIKED
jgi:hypothetical protein